MRLSILKDPRYAEFMLRYHADPLAFAIEVCGLSPSEDQMDLFDAISPSNARVSVVSGTTTGKTVAFAVIALWHFLCFPFATVEGKLEIGSNTYIAAPVVQQVADGVWKNMHDHRVAMLQSKHAWITQHFDVMKTRVEMRGYEQQWFIGQVALKKGESVSIAGKHRYWQLIIVDEAAGVSDDHAKVIDGTQSQGGNRTLLASQGVRNAGWFYDTHHSASKAQGGRWTALRFNSENSPFVEEERLAEVELVSGGRHSVEYQIRVLGLFATDSANNLLSRAEVEAAFARGRIIGDDEPWGWVVLGDVAMGEYRDDSVCVVARVIGDSNEDRPGAPNLRRVEFDAIPIASYTKGPVDFAGDLLNQAAALDNSMLYVDAGGAGAVVCKLIEGSYHHEVNRINWGKPCFLRQHQERFFNERAAGCVRLRDAWKQGRVSITARVPQQVRNKIIDQGSRLPYEFVESGGLKYKMLSKQTMLKEHSIKSPDIFDCFAFPFIPGVEYRVSSAAGVAKQGDAVKSAVERMKARRAAERAATERGGATSAS